MDRYEESEFDPVLRAVTSHWITKIKAARDHKRKVFQEYADECLNFYNGPKDWDDLMGGIFSPEDLGADPAFKVSVNKTFEFVTIFGPALYYENPVRTVKPRMPVIVPPSFFPDPMVYQSLMMQENARIQADGLRSVLLESYLNYTPVEFNLATEARLAIDEALIKGRGCLWTELYSPPGSDIRIVRSLWDSTDRLYVDPDAPSFQRATWVARRCVHPVWQVERDYGLRTGSLKGNCESQAKQADIETSDDAQYDRKRGLSNDLLVYYKIYSKMGIGGRLQGLNRDYRRPLEIFGDFAYVVVAEGVPFPLNLPPDVVNDPAFQSDPQAVFARTAWPTPFWADDDWPVSVLDFHAVHNSTWPMAHLKAGMGELKFINWAMSFLMGKIRNTSRDFIAVLKSASEEIKTAILEGRDLTLLEIDAEHKTIQEVIQFLQHPEMNGDIWKVIQAVENNFDKRVGLTELMYGQEGSTQIRSAEEANLRNQNMNVRPDDMRKQVEAWMARVAAKEAVAARYHLIPNDVQKILGLMGSWAWGQFVSTRDLPSACRELEYRIEAGSTQRPNKGWEVRTMNDALQALAPLLQAYAQQTGDLTPMNNLLADYAKARDLDPSRYQLRTNLPPISPVIPGSEQGAVPEAGVQAQAQSNVPAPG
jgi:hypothetical protein